jgi:hypothetical protein
MNMRKALIFGVFVLLSVAIVVVQAQSAECPELVEEALNSVDDLCSDLDRNTACYGASDIESETVVSPRPEDFFVAPGDLAGLEELTEIHPLPIDVDEKTFGVGVMNVQADVPNTVPGQAVIFLLMGGATMTNEGAPETEGQAPFQSFYFLPGIGQSPCYQADPMMTIQTPGNIAITITFNGIETEMSPGTLLTITDKVCTIHRGNIIQNPGTNQAVLLANQTVDITIDDKGAISVLGLRGISELEYERGEQIQAAINAVAKANGWQEQFVKPPDEFAPEPASTTGDSGTCGEQHTVVSGDTLHKIAEQYDTSVLSIVEANDITNPRVITAGQVFCIPNPGSGFEPLPAGQ